MSADEGSAIDLAELAKRVSNWGRWGPDDQRGTLNLVDDAAVGRGIACARRGAVFSLAIPFDEDGPQLGNIEGRNNPRTTRHIVNMAWAGGDSAATWNDDHLDLGTQAATHWDTLAHCSYEGLLYNGVSNTVVTAEEGATRFGVETIGPVVGRAIMLDVARALGYDEHLPPTYEIIAADLDAAARIDVDIEPGDILLVRTGQMAVWRRDGRDPYSQKSPGLGVDTVSWLREHDVGAVATDTLTFEPMDFEDTDYSFPTQKILLRDVGLALGQLWDLDALAADCATDGRHGVLLVANPLPVTRGIGGPVAPVAIK